MQNINRIGTPVVNSLHRKGYPVPIGHTSIYLRTKVYLVNCCNLKKVFEAKRSPQKMKLFVILLVSIGFAHCLPDGPPSCNVNIEDGHGKSKVAEEP